MSRERNEPPMAQRPSRAQPEAGPHKEPTDEAHSPLDTTPSAQAITPDAVQPLTHTAYLGLGSNLGDRGMALADAVAALHGLHPTLVVSRISSLYDTAPQLVTDQPRFLNAAVEVRTSLSPHELLRAAKRIEHELGRVAGPRYGPRRIDIDVLLYDDLVYQSHDLVVPHPRLVERAFALQPLAELAPLLRHPTSGQTIAALAAARPDGDVRGVGPFPAQGGKQTRELGSHAESAIADSGGNSV